MSEDGSSQLQLRHTAAMASGSESNNSSATRRIREDLQNVMRMSLGPLVEDQSSAPSTSRGWQSFVPVSSPTASIAPNHNDFVISMSNMDIPYFNNVSPVRGGTAAPQPPPSSGESNPTDQEAPTHAHPTPPQPTHDPEGDSGGEESVTSTISSILSQNPELRQTFSALEKYIPFLLLLIFKATFDHGTGIVTCIGLFITFFHSNSVVCHQVSRQGKRNVWALFAVFVNLLACILFIYFVFKDEQLYLCAVFFPPKKVDSLYDLLWIVGVNDFILKFVAVIIKIFVAVLPAGVLPYQKRGKYFLFIERCSQLHRSLTPIQVWLMYLLDGFEKIPGKVVGVILTAAYMVAKGKLLLRSAKQWKRAFSTLLQSTRYGKCPTKDQVKTSGGFCPICHDNYSEPTMLHCKHIFCEECVATWFDRERTCPMCRAQVTEDPAWRDGSTSQFLQLF